MKVTLIGMGSAPTFPGMGGKGDAKRIAFLMYRSRIATPDERRTPTVRTDPSFWRTNPITPWPD